MKITLPVKYLIIAVFLFSAANLYAQKSHLFFASPVAEVVMYGRAPPSIGYGFMFGAEDNVSIGVKGIYAMSFEENDLTTLEITIFFRLYLSGAESGLFAQLTYGFAIFSGENTMSLPAESGAFSFGLTAGWRFPLGRYFFIEPYVRAGYPYYGGAGLSTGVRF